MKTLADILWKMFLSVLMALTALSNIMENHRRKRKYWRAYKKARRKDDREGRKKW